jgi:glycosyltransferase involved in cell wall biosynthesis
MRYSIITPTICRPSLLRLCRSIDRQTHSNWEHLIVVDLPEASVTKGQQEIIAAISHTQNRRLFYCEKKHSNYGHTCRHQAWEFAKGDYIFYVDDDDYLADNDVLTALDSVKEAWGVFPMIRHGKVFFGLPPGTGNTGTGMFIHKKEIGRWPASDSYETDGLFVEELVRKYPYQIVDSKPIVVQPRSSFGLTNADSWWGDKLAKLVGRWLWYRYLAKTRIL